MSAMHSAPAQFLARHRVAVGRIAVAAVAIWFPFASTALWLNIAVLTLFAIVGAQSLNMLTGLVGQISLGNAAFLAIGSFGAVFVGESWGLSFIPCVLAGVLLSVAIGALLATFALRLRGFYLALGTIALLYAVVYGFGKYQYEEVGAGSFILDAASIGGFDLDTDTAWYYFLLIGVLPLCWGFANLLRTRFGRAAAMIRSREAEAVVFGISPRRMKFSAFCWSSGLIGLQGALFAYYLGSTSSNVFTVDLAIQYVAMVVIGGLGYTWGAVFGAAFVIGLPFALEGVGGSADAINTFVYGFAIVFFLLIEPDGIVGVLRRLARFAPRRATSIVVMENAAEELRPGVGR